MNKKSILKQIIEINKESDNWLHSVPYDIRDAFFGNKYVINLEKINGILLNNMFSIEERDWVDWVLYEWRDGLSFWVDEVEYTPRSRLEANDMVFTLGLIEDEEDD